MKKRLSRNKTVKSAMPTQPPNGFPQAGLNSRTPAPPLKLLTFFQVPWMWLGFSAVVLGLDYRLGPFVHLSILFVLPVAAAAWHRGLKYALPLAFLLPCFRLLFYALWDAPLIWIEAGISCLVRVVVLATIAGMTAHLRRQANEIRLLRGLLPICMHCKKIRDTQGAWEPIEKYISSQTEARFSHGLCPDCLKKYYGDVPGNSAG